LLDIRQQVQLFIIPAYRLVQIIQWITFDYYSTMLNKIEKINKELTMLENQEPDNKDLISGKISKFSQKMIRKIEKIDEDIEKLFNNFPYHLESQYIVILTRRWNEIKEELTEKINLLSKKKKVYKCEIMHEILDPDVDDIWQCSNCGTVVCGKHLEKWYYKKKSPECFKCGKIGTFKPIKDLKNLN